MLVATRNLHRQHQIAHHVNGDSCATNAPARADCTPPQCLAGGRRVASLWRQYRESTARLEAVAWCNQNVPAAMPTRRPLPPYRAHGRTASSLTTRTIPNSCRFTGSQRNFAHNANALPEPTASPWQEPRVSAARLGSCNAVGKWLVLDGRWRRSVATVFAPVGLGWTKAVRTYLRSC
jgi:hypothetical protein